MRSFAALSLLAAVASVTAFKFHAKVPFSKEGNPLSHQLPHLNIPLTGATNVDVGVDVPAVGTLGLGKRRLVKDYIPSNEELAALRREFEHVIPADVKRESSSVKLNGVVALFSYAKGFMGYIALQLTQYGTTPLTTDTSKVAFLKIPSATPSPHFNLGIYNASDPYLAVIQGYSGSNWGTGNPGYGSMTVVQDSSYPASNLYNPTYLPSESNIWTIDDTTGQLTATWFNDNGTPVPCQIYYDVTYGDFGFSGDLAAYVKLYLDNTIQVYPYFVGLW